LAGFKKKGENLVRGGDRERETAPYKLGKIRKQNLPRGLEKGTGEVWKE